MNHCGEKFHGEVAKFRFLNELIKVLSPKVGVLGLTACPGPLAPAGPLVPRPHSCLRLAGAEGGGPARGACSPRSLPLVGSISQPPVGVAGRVGGWARSEGLTLGGRCLGRDGTGHQVWLEVHGTSGLVLCTLRPAPSHLPSHLPSWVTTPASAVCPPAECSPFWHRPPGQGRPCSCRAQPAQTTPASDAAASLGCPQVTALLPDQLQS